MKGVQTHGGPLGFHLDLAISPFHEPGGKAAAGGSRFSQQFHLCHPTERRHHAPPDTVIKLRCFFSPQTSSNSQSLYNTFISIRFIWRLWWYWCQRWVYWIQYREICKKVWVFQSTSLRHSHVDPSMIGAALPWFQGLPRKITTSRSLSNRSHCINWQFSRAMSNYQRVFW